MKTYEKANKYIILYILGFIATLGVFITWIILLNTTTGSEPGDKWLLGTMFGMLFGGEAAFIWLFFKTPREIVAFDEEGVTIFQSRRKTKYFPFPTISSFASTKRNVYLMTKKNTMHTIRFTVNVKQLEYDLRYALNEYIKAHEENYFADEVVSKKDK